MTGHPRQAIRARPRSTAMRLVLAARTGIGRAGLRPAGSAVGNQAQRPAARRRDLGEAAGCGRGRAPSPVAVRDRRCRACATRIRAIAWTACRRRAPDRQAVSRLAVADSLSARSNTGAHVSAWPRSLAGITATAEPADVDTPVAIARPRHHDVAATRHRGTACPMPIVRPRCATGPGFVAEPDSASAVALGTEYARATHRAAPDVSTGIRGASSAPPARRVRRLRSRPPGHVIRLLTASSRQHARAPSASVDRPEPARVIDRPSGQPRSTSTTASDRS